MDRLVARIREGKSFLVTSHIRIDGDGIASALAIDLLLKGLGKKSMVLISGPVPHVFKFLPGTQGVMNFVQHPGIKRPDDLDTVVMVDVADKRRLGTVGEMIPDGVTTLSIDHHREGGTGADIDYCDEKASSAGELVHLLLKRGNFPIAPDVATCIFTAILTDTQRFSLPNATSESMRVCAEMIELGAQPGVIGDRVYRSYLPGQIALRAEVIEHLEFDPDGRLAWTILTEEMLKRHDVAPDDTQDFTDIARMLHGVEVGVLFRKRGDADSIRVSLRSNHIPVLSVAEEFGGGGHNLACGCELPGTLEEVQQTILDRVRKLIADGS